VHSLAEAVPLAHPRALSAREPIAAFLRERAPDALLVGPDAESEQWVSAVGRRAGLDWCVGEKIRRGDRDVSIRLHGDFAGRHVVLVDDVASTGRTLEVAARTVLDAGAAVVSAVVTHALFADDAVERLRAAGVREIWSTDSIPHPSNVIALAPLLAAALQE
jgi:ribose-phosphate pyrophosphokinase